MHPRLEDFDDSDIDLDTQEFAAPIADEPLGYGYGEWASGTFRPSRQRGAPFAGRGPRGYQRSDIRIYEEVCDRLTDDPGVDASEIQVAVHDGEVALRGQVLTREMRRRADDVAFDIAGVRHVSNDLRIVPPPKVVVR